MATVSNYMEIVRAHEALMAATDESAAFSSTSSVAVTAAASSRGARVSLQPPVQAANTPTTVDVFYPRERSIDRMYQDVQPNQLVFIPRLLAHENEAPTVFPLASLSAINFIMYIQCRNPMFRSVEAFKTNYNLLGVVHNHRPLINEDGTEETRYVGYGRVGVTHRASQRTINYWLNEIRHRKLETHVGLHLWLIFRPVPINQSPPLVLGTGEALAHHAAPYSPPDADPPKAVREVVSEIAPPVQGGGGGGGGGGVGGGRGDPRSAVDDALSTSSWSDVTKSYSSSSSSTSASLLGAPPPTFSQSRPPPPPTPPPSAPNPTDKSKTPSAPDLPPIQTSAREPSSSALPATPASTAADTPPFYFQFLPYVSVECTPPPEDLYVSLKERWVGDVWYVGRLQHPVPLSSEQLYNYRLHSFMYPSDPSWTDYLPSMPMIDVLVKC